MSNQTKSEELKAQVKNQANSVTTQASNQASQVAQNAVNDAKSTVAGQVAGAVSGGIQSLTAKKDAFKGQLNDAKQTAEGLLSGDLSSIENMATDMVNDAIGGLLSKFGAKVEIGFSEPDSNGVVTPISSTLSTDQTASDKISGVLSLITGLGISPGNLQSVITDASPAGLINAAKENISGNIGAFGSADSLKSLASDKVKSVTSELVAQIGPQLAASKNINKTVANYVVDQVTGDVTSTVQNISTPDFADDSAEFFTAIAKMEEGIDSDLSQSITQSRAAKFSEEGAKVDLENLSGGKDGGKVLNAVQSESESVSRYSKKVSEMESKVRTKTRNPDIGIVAGISADTLSQLNKQVKAFAPTLSEESIAKIIALSQGDVADESEAIRILSDITGKSFSDIKAFLKSLDVTISASTKPAVDNNVFAPPYVIGSYEKTWEKGTNDPVFPYISSVAELQAEVNHIEREFESVIVHWTETPTNKNIGSEEINALHVELGLDGIGYHYIIRRDGSLQRGRPVGLEGQHAPGFDEKSIGIAFVGGVNAPSGTPNEGNFLSAQSLTRSQLNTFDHFCRAMYNKYPGVLILGHSDVDFTGENIDPGFDVPDYVLTRFGKTNAQGRENA